MSIAGFDDDLFQAMKKSVTVRKITSN